jgi:hypothetical protein
MKRFLVVSVALALFAVAPMTQAQRQRAVRIPAAPCSFALTLGFLNPVPDLGLVRGRIDVLSSSPSCVSWNAYSPVDWITFEPGDTAAAAAVTVQPNASSEARTAVVHIAGLDLGITQLGKVDVPIVDTGIVQNGTFTSDLTNWGWQERFPNGTGSVTWSNLDADGSSVSGSMRLRNTLLTGPGMQQLQCVSVTAGQIYDFQFAYRMQASSGLMQVSVFHLDSTDCSGVYTLDFTQQYFPSGNDNWFHGEGTFRVGGGARSALIVFASKTQSANQSFDTYIDDVTMNLQ